MAVIGASMVYEISSELCTIQWSKAYLFATLLISLEKMTKRYGGPCKELWGKREDHPANEKYCGKRKKISCQFIN